MGTLCSTAEMVEEAVPIVYVPHSIRYTPRGWVPNGGLIYKWEL